MANESNLDKTQLHAVFVQANTIKGHRYLDLSGVVVNRIGGLYDEITIDPGGCLMRKPKDAKDPYAIRFSTDRIWLHYVQLNSLAFVVDTAPEWIGGIAKDIEVTRFSRLGLRCEYFAPCADIISASIVLSRKVTGAMLQDMIAPVNDAEDVFFEYTARVPVKNFIAGIRTATVRTLRPPREPTDYPGNGLLFDVDMYRRGKLPDGFSHAETRGFVKLATENIHILLERIGYRLLEVSNGTDS